MKKLDIMDVKKAVNNGEMHTVIWDGFIYLENGGGERVKIGELPKETPVFSEEEIQNLWKAVSSEWK